MVHYRLSNKTQSRATPRWLYEDLNKRFHFDDDPCPLGGSEGLDREWGSCSFVNPPYNRYEVEKWILKALEERGKGKIVVMLLKSVTETKWFQDLVLPNATEVIFIRGRVHYLKDGITDTRPPFPSVIIVFKPESQSIHSERMLTISSYNQKEKRIIPVLIGERALDTPRYPNK